MHRQNPLFDVNFPGNQIGLLLINDHKNFAIKEINQIMRTTGVLVEVNVPDGKCFGDCEL